MSLPGTRVVITGAGSGIGRDFAHRFFAAGASLVLGGRDASKLDAVRRELGDPGRVLCVPGDVAKPATGRALAEAADAAFGGADVLINNAGIFGTRPFLDSTEADLDRYYATNVKGTFFVTQAIVPLMIRAGGGSIVNVGTVLVHHGASSLPVAAPMASKGGVHALTVALAAELARHRIRVNTLAPGIVRTPLIGEGADALVAIHPIGRIGEVRDTSDAALYLATASFVTGTTLVVDGGYTHAR